MNKKANNYMVIIIVLLLVVAIITGAGLCYLSWSEDYNPLANNQTQSTESSVESTGREDALANAKEEGRQEILDSIKENLDANISAEDILNQLLGETSDEGVQSTETTIETTEVPKVECEILSANTITMAQIDITAEGEYEYIKDGKVASHKGIDVSKYQGNVDWKKVAEDYVEYAFIRVGCRGYGSSGTLIKDEKFHQNVKGALDQGIKVGVYFFTQAITTEEALEEAELVLKELGDYKITYPVAIDVERVENAKARQDALTAEERTEICKVFCEKIKEAGYIPMVYGDNETFAELIIPEELAEYDFWICETGGTMTFPYEFAVWQYSHKGTVSGIKGDTNISISLKEW